MMFSCTMSYNYPLTLVQPPSELSYCLGCITVQQGRALLYDQKVNRSTTKEVAKYENKGVSSTLNSSAD